MGLVPKSEVLVVAVGRNVAKVVPEDEVCLDRVTAFVVDEVETEQDVLGIFLIVGFW